MTDADWARVMAGDPGTIALHVRSAAEHGFRGAQITWGQMLLDGRYAVRDRTAALRWFRRAAEAGSADGINMVGRCHELGWGTRADHPEAARWYRRASVKGSAWGAYNLACMLLYGSGVPHDPGAAVAQFAVSAERGNAKAMGMLGRCHEGGWGVPPDPAEALRWYRRGAEGDDCWAQYNLAVIALGAGRRDEALALLRRSLAVGSANYLLAVADDLAGADDEALRGVAATARERSAALAGDAPSMPDRPSVARRLLRRLTGRTGAAPPRPAR